MSLQFPQAHQGFTQSLLVTNFSSKLNDQLVTGSCSIPFPFELLDVGDPRQAEGHAPFVSQLAFDRQRLLVVSQPLIGLVQIRVGEAYGLEDIAFRLSVPRLNRQGQTSIEGLESYLCVTLLSQRPTAPQQRAEVLRIHLENPRIMILCPVEEPCAFIQETQLKVQIGIIGPIAKQILIRLDACLQVIGDPSVRCQNLIALLIEQIIAQLDCFTGVPFRLLTMTDVEVDLSQLGIGQREVRIFGDRSLELLDGLQVLAFAYQPQTQGIEAKRHDRFRGRLEGLRL